MKKVLILNPYIPTLGGGEKHMVYLCRFIETYFNNNVRIDIMVFNYNTVNVFDVNYITIEDVMKQFNVQLNCTYIKKVDIPLSKNRREKVGNWRRIENAARGYDLFVNFTFLSKHRGKAKKNMYVCMFPPQKVWCNHPKNHIKNSIAKLYNYLFYGSYNVFIPNSYFTKYWLETYWETNKKNVVIFPPAFFEDDIVNRYNENEKKNIILSVGRFFVGSHCKKQLEMVQFFVGHEDVFMDYEYHLAGMVSQDESDIDYLNMIKELARESERVFVHENCSYEELVSLYKQAKIFWHATGYGIDENAEPEKMEHFGITTVEAMSYGVVPVVINKGGQPEIVDEGKNGFIWNNEDECIRKTNKLIADDQMRKKMALSAVEKAKMFSIEAFYRRNKVVFDELRV